MEIRPFRGWRYRPGPDGDISPFIAPPYDILSAADKEQLLAADERNVVAFDLPHVPPKELGPDRVYEQAARLLERLQATGVLVRDDEPSIYVYEQTYTWSGRTYVRRAMICGVRATELGKDIIPHEHVFPGPLADRLRLTETTRTQLSPIFGFYEDRGGQVTAVLSAAAAGEPVAHGVLRGVGERLWKLSDAGKIRTVAEALRDVPAFIADGHHRYTTARNYCKWRGASGPLDADHEANFVMFALVERSDPGLVILPTHRIFGNLHEAGSVEKLAAASPEFSWRKCGTGEMGPAAIEALLGCAGPGAMAFVAGRNATVWIVELARPEAMHHVAPDETEEWRTLPPAILHRLIMAKALRPWILGELSVRYTPEINDVLDACRSGRAQLGVVLPATRIETVQAIGLSGRSMPHKSTYFYPKLATGMVFKPLQ